MISFKIKAIHALRPNAEWVLRDDELEWIDTEQSEPTEEERARKALEEAGLSEEFINNLLGNSD
mgnify:CR=1 FL=1